MRRVLAMCVVTMLMAGCGPGGGSPATEAEPAPTPAHTVAVPSAPKYTSPTVLSSSPTRQVLGVLGDTAGRGGVKFSVVGLRLEKECTIGKAVNNGRTLIPINANQEPAIIAIGGLDPMPADQPIII